MQFRAFPRISAPVLPHITARTQKMAASAANLIVMADIVKYMNARDDETLWLAHKTFDALVEGAPKCHFTLKTWTADKGEELKKCNVSSIDNAVKMLDEAVTGTGRWSEGGRHYEPRTVIAELWMSEAGVCRLLVFHVNIPRHTYGASTAMEETERMEEREFHQLCAQAKRNAKR